jgi:hypothetical protein
MRIFITDITEANRIIEALEGQCNYRGVGFCKPDCLAFAHCDKTGLFILSGVSHETARKISG